jgi:hypothetical protein
MTNPAEQFCAEHADHQARDRDLARVGGLMRRCRELRPVGYFDSCRWVRGAGKHHGLG